MVYKQRQNHSLCKSITCEVCERQALASEKYLRGLLNNKEIY